MKQHLADNGVARQDAKLVKAAVAGHDGDAWFHVGDAADWYGQAIANAPDSVDEERGRVAKAVARVTRRRQGRSVRRVKAVSLNTLLRGESIVDLIDIDVQGAEAEVLEPAADLLHERVRRVFVGTHSHENEERVRALFTRLGWACTYDFPGSGESDTPWGRIHFEDGVQAWRNPDWR